LLDQTGTDPRRGLAPGPVTVIGVNQPSLAFLLGPETEFGEADDGVQAILEGRPVVVEQASDRDFQHALASEGLKAVKLGAISGFDYVANTDAVLSLYRSAGPPQAFPRGAPNPPDVAAGPGPETKPFGKRTP